MLTLGINLAAVCANKGLIVFKIIKVLTFRNVSCDLPQQEYEKESDKLG